MTLTEEEIEIITNIAQENLADVPEDHSFLSEYGEEGVLDFSTANLDDEDIERIAQIIALYPDYVTTLNLSNSNITEAGMGFLAEMLAHNKIKTLVLNSCKGIDDEAALSLMNAIPDNSNLQVLDLGNCSITAKGVEHIANKIQDQSLLTYLTLSDNKIGSKGAEHIGTILQNNKTLCSLDLDNCGITDIGAAYIKHALTKNYFLTSITLEDAIVPSMQDKITSCTDERNERIKDIAYDLTQDGEKEDLTIDAIRFLAPPSHYALAVLNKILVLYPNQDDLIRKLTDINHAPFGRQLLQYAQNSLNTATVPAILKPAELEFLRTANLEVDLALPDAAEDALSRSSSESEGEEEAKMAHDSDDSDDQDRDPSPTPSETSVGSGSRPLKKRAVAQTPGG